MTILMRIMVLLWINFFNCSLGWAKDIEINVGMGQLYNFKSEIGSVMIADENVANFDHPPYSNQIYIYGKKVGATSITITNLEGRLVWQRNVIIQHPLKHIYALINERFPNQRVELFSSNENILVKGEVRNLQMMKDIEQIILPFIAKGKLLNRLQVKVPNRVRLYVRLVKINRSIFDKFGIDWRQMFKLTTFEPNLNRLGKFSESYEDLNEMIDSMSKRGWLSILSEPNLSTISGKPANFRYGRQFPVPESPQARQVSKDNPLYVPPAINYKFAGIDLEFTPNVMHENAIRLDIKSEISKLEDNLGNVNGNELPYISNHAFQTTIDLSHGGSFSIAGLFEDDRSYDQWGNGLVGNLPLFNQINQGFNNRQTEMIIVITPYLVGQSGKELTRQKPIEHETIFDINQLENGFSALQF